MRTTIFFLTLFFLPVLFLAEESVSTYIWPVGGEKIESKLTSLFGESRGDHFHNGIDIASDSEKIVSISDGKILYSRYSSDNPFENEHGSGNAVWILHPNNIYSAYFHLKEGRFPIVLTDSEIKQNTPIAKTGNTGHSSGSHLHFITVKNYGRNIFDPLTIMPSVKDNTSPTIGNMIVTIGKSKTYIRDGDSFNNSKEFPVSIEIFDSGEKKGQRRGIKTIQIEFNGELYKKASFKEFTLVKNQWKNEEGYNFDELYFENNYFIGNLNFNSGTNTLILKVEDFNGNKSTKNFAFFVNKIKRKD